MTPKEKQQPTASVSTPERDQDYLEEDYNYMKQQQ